MARLAAFATLGAFLGGCTGAGPGDATPVMNAWPQLGSRSVSARMAATAAGPLNGETFTAAHVTVRRGSYCQNEHNADAFFTTSGTATGPYPGTFTASGHWWSVNDSGSGFFWGFTENFTIASSSGHLAGFANTTEYGPHPMLRCFLFGPAGPKDGLYYSTTLVSSDSGSLRVDRIRRDQTFIEEFL